MLLFFILLSYDGNSEAIAESLSSKNVEPIREVQGAVKLSQSGIALLWNIIGGAEVREELNSASNFEES